MAGVLKQLAAQMWREAGERGKTQRNLSGGLRVAVKWNADGTRQLGLSRGADRVPWDECAIAATAFGVPKGVKGETMALQGEWWTIYSWAFVAEQQSLFEGGEA